MAVTDVSLALKAASLINPSSGVKCGLQACSECFMKCIKSCFYHNRNPTVEVWHETPSRGRERCPFKHSIECACTFQLALTYAWIPAQRICMKVFFGSGFNGALDHVEGKQHEALSGAGCAGFWERLRAAVPGDDL